ncbi:cysteine proteinase [Piedraia hortae CBS 480.64]|uniref:Cysteine proteinase n=1 Tax=Piedraia hortae CBS 480.64 TaxID=1314780 RepID=A0A6A7C0G7_9PEZI|nr:cysteine proteinase [Piedraia hortae CBS 480.64]
MTGVELTRKDFGTLLARTSQEISHEWLNDEIVNAFMSAIVENRKAHDKYDKESGKAPALAAFQTGWYNTWKSRGVSGIARWSRRMGIKGNKLLGAEHIFFPINSGVHWTLLLISPKSRTINHLDSMGSKSGEMLQFAREWLRMELGDAYVASEWTVAKGSSSRQDNSDDCGVFACFNALAVAEKRSFEDVTAEQMQDARKMLAALLLDPLAWREFGLTH